MAKTGFSVDLKDFDKRFSRIIKKAIPEESSRALFQAGAMLLRDAIKEKPYAPHKTGNLWKSQRVEKPKIEHRNISVEVGFNTEYAAAVHEAPSNRNWTLPGSGPKFLETKIIKNKEKYMKSVADFVRGRAR